MSTNIIVHSADLFGLLKYANMCRWPVISTHI